MIEFPGLWGLRITVDPTAIKLGSISIYWYGIIIAVAFALAVVLALRNSKKFDIEPENILDLVLVVTIPAIIFARIYYVIFSWDSYKGDFLKMINIREGGLAIYGGVLGAVLMAYIFTKVKKIPPLKLFDFASPYLILAQGIGRWGNFVNQEAFGSNTTLPWGMTSVKISSYLKGVPGADPNVPVHPTFLYESLWNIGAFFVLIWFRKRKKVEGEVFFLYMILYGLGRAWIEGLRTDSLMVGNLRISQILAVLFALGFSLIFFMRRQKAMAPAVEAAQPEGGSKYGNIMKSMEEDKETAAAEGAVTEEVSPEGEAPEEESAPDMDGTAQSGDKAQ